MCIMCMHVIIVVGGATYIRSITMPPKRHLRDSDPSLKKRSKRYCSFSSAWKSEELKMDVGGCNHKMFSGTVLSGADGDSDAFCTLCKLEFRRYSAPKILGSPYL